VSEGKSLGRRVRSVAFKLALVLAVTFGIAEFGLRYLLFAEGAGPRSLVLRVRHESNLAGQWSEEYWALRYRFSDPARRVQRPRFDPLLGWTGPRVEQETYRHAEATSLNGRRPVLLYGDSFGHCLTGAEDCWEGLLERSERSGELRLLNYAAGGYGMDQAYLCMLQTLDLYQDQNPIVIFSFLVDDDMDRSNLGFRAWPKPRLGVTPEGGLEVVKRPIEDSVEYVTAFLSKPRSYAWRYWVHGLGLRNRFPGAFDDEQQTYAETQSLVTAMLEDIQREMARRQLDYFVLLFHGRPYVTRDKDDWREPFALSELERLGIPYISSKPRLRAAALRTQQNLTAFYFQDGRGKGHYSPLGNEAVFAGILDGLRGKFDTPGVGVIERPGQGAQRGSR
jgi:hypothetical protein